MGLRRRWWVAFLALLAVLGALVLPGCGTGGSAASEDPAQADEAMVTLDEDGADEGASAEDGGTAEDDSADSTEKSASTDTKKSKSVTTGKASSSKKDDEELSVSEDGTYTSKEEVALYLHEYGHLPSNYVTKDEAEDAGWKAAGLHLDEACPGKSIGGDRFGNREKRLPAKKGRTWYECDIDYMGGPRGAKRIVYSNDGLIYYTKDHYKTFEKLY